MKTACLQLCAIFCVAAGSALLLACPFCDAPSLLMSEQIQQCDHVLLGRWVSGEKPTETRAGTAKFEIIAVQRSSSDRFQVGETIELPQYIAGSETSNYALMGPDGRLEDWQSPMEVSEPGWKYLAELPEPATDPVKQSQRLLYALKHLEHPDLMISNDAYSEFAAAPYEVITPLRDQFPREKLRQWVLDPKTSVTRMGLYGLLLGLCGQEEDAAAIEKKILVPDLDFRLGIEGVMSGYLLIRGEPGLQFLEETKMTATTCVNAAGEEVKLPFSETYAAMQALRFMWTYEPDRLSKDRLKQSMRLLLERPELSDLVIADLARWKDWQIQDRLMAMYDDEKFNIPAVKRAIVRFLYYCSQDKPAPSEGAADEAIPEYAVTAAAYLAELEKKDPKTVNDAKRYLIR